VESDDHNTQVGEVAVSEIVAGIAALRGPKGLEDLVVDLAGILADLIKGIAAAEGLAAEDVADVLFFGEGSTAGAASGACALLDEPSSDPW
jgi:hypothetical protein